MVTSFDCVIVGAGIAGMLAATDLEAAGKRVLVLEKGRGLGGRMATRRWEGAVFDHGAQFFTARDPRFRERVEEWIGLGLVEPWYEFPEGEVHYRGVPSMTSVAKHLAANLNNVVRRECLVEAVRRMVDGRWEVTLAGGELVSGRTLLMTAPVPQSLALLDAGGVGIDGDARARLEGIEFHKCIAAMAILDGPSALTMYGGSLKLHDQEPIQWMADNQRKGVSPEVPSVTIHSTPAFAEAHWNSPDEERLPPLLEAAADYLKATVMSAHGHRWGFSQPKAAFGEEAFVDRDRGLAIAGDGLAGGRVEGAALSGMVAGELLGAVSPGWME